MVALYLHWVTHLSRALEDLLPKGHKCLGLHWMLSPAEAGQPSGMFDFQPVPGLTPTTPRGAAWLTSMVGFYGIHVDICAKPAVVSYIRLLEHYGSSEKKEVAQEHF